MNCKEAAELASRALDTRLSWRATVQLRLHLVICAACRRYSAQLRIMRTAMRRLADKVGVDETELSRATRRRIAQARSGDHGDEKHRRP